MYKVPEELEDTFFNFFICIQFVWLHVARVFGFSYRTLQIWLHTIDMLVIILQLIWKVRKVLNWDIFQQVRFKQSFIIFKMSKDYVQNVNNLMMNNIVLSIVLKLWN